MGVDVESLGSRPAEFYAEWTRREAIAKCHGTGLGAPLPDGPVAARASPPGRASPRPSPSPPSALPLLRHFAAEPLATV